MTKILIQYSLLVCFLLVTVTGSWAQSNDLRSIRKVDPTNTIIKEHLLEMNLEDGQFEQVFATMKQYVKTNHIKVVEQETLWLAEQALSARINETTNVSERIQLEMKLVYLREHTLLFEDLYSQIYY